MGDTALQTLVNRYSGDNITQFTRAMQKAQLVVAVKTGDIDNLRRLVECEEMDIHARDHV